MWSRKSGPFLGGTALGRIFLAFGALFVIVGSYPLINSCSAFTNCNWLTTASAGAALLPPRLQAHLERGGNAGRGRGAYFLSQYILAQTPDPPVTDPVPSHTVDVVT